MAEDFFGNIVNLDSRAVIQESNNFVLAERRTVREAVSTKRNSLQRVKPRGKAGASSVI